MIILFQYILLAIITKYIESLLSNYWDILNIHDLLKKVNFACSKRCKYKWIINIRKYLRWVKAISKLYHKHKLTFIDIEYLTQILNLINELA